MSVLVDELLLLAQLDAGRPLAREPVDLTRLAIDAASDARAATPDHRWRLELPDEPVMVRGDEHRLRQVLANLMGNAGSHTPPGTTVRWRSPSRPGRRVVLSVTDDGASPRPAARLERLSGGDSSARCRGARARAGDRGRGDRCARRQRRGDEPAGPDQLRHHAARHGGAAERPGRAAAGTRGGHG
jgi:two-component system OmpR family sensor kinase